MQAAIWLELRLPAAAIDDRAFERLCKGLEAAGSAVQTDAGTGRSERIAWFNGGKDHRRLRASIAAAAMLMGVPERDIHLSVLAGDWETPWQKDWKAMPTGKRLWIRPSFHEPPVDDRIDIVLDPGMAFGTGQHATTRLCLEAIERVCMKEPPASMLDMGAGSGILAIAAAKLGVKQVLAIDNDPDAVAACGKNADINGVVIHSALGDTPPDTRFNLVVANILAGPLIGMAPRLALCTEETLVLSGLLAEQVEAVSRAYEAEGLKVVRTSAQDEWTAVELRML